MNATNPGSVSPTRSTIRSEARSLVVDGRTRTYLIVAPSQLPTGRALPLVLVLHGSNQTGKRVQAFSGHTFDTYALNGQAVVVYPDAYKGLWNDARTGLRAPARTEHVDDVVFLQALLRAVQQTYRTGAVYVVGYSNGGQMAIRLLHEIPDELAGVALIGATQPTPDNFAAADQHIPLPVLLIHGTSDPIVPYAGGIASIYGFRPRGRGMSAPESAQYFATRNGITTPGVTESLPHHASSGRTSVTVTHFAQPGKKPVTLYTIENGGHVIPNPNKRALFLLGQTTHDINAAEVIWQFLTEQRA